VPPTRKKVLYGAEVWVLEGLNDRVIEFQQGQFHLAKHAHVYLCGTDEMAEKVIKAISPVSDKAMIEDINREYDRPQG